MKKYIGTKQVMAKPMTKGEAGNAGLLLHNPEFEGEREIPGYLVEYADGYKSWSPADVFEAAYKVAETPLDRVNIEAADLLARANKLGNFIYNQNEGKDFQSLSLGTRAFLLAQHYAMGAYLKLLCLRQSCMEGNEECRPWGLSFEQIFPMIREGLPVRRSSWGENGRMVFKQVPSHITNEIIPGMQSLPSEAKRQILAAGDHIDYVAQCLIFDPCTGEANSWTPSVEDLFANDWALVL